MGQSPGVHPATASRALNLQTRLLASEQAASRALAAAAELGYRLNAVARSLRTRRPDTVGVLIPDLNNRLFPPMARGLADRLESHGYVALIGNTDGGDDRSRRVLEQMRARHVDGYVLATAHLRDVLLTTIAFSHYQVGAHAAGLPLERLNGRIGQCKVSYVLPRLIIHGSTGPLCLTPVRGRFPDRHGPADARRGR